MRSIGVKPPFFQITLPKNFDAIRKNALLIGALKARSHRGRLPGLSTIHLLDARRELRFASHRRSFRWIRSGTESGRAKTRFDFARHRTPHHEWNRGRSTDSQAFPKIQIIFLSQETSADVVEEALSTGACGYVVKTKAASQLVGVVKAVV